MHHVAIMRPDWKLIPKILSGEKVIESRWYQTRRTPWDRIHAGDTVYFKDSGNPVTARAEVVEVLQFELNGIEDANKIVQEYGDEICLVNRNPATWGKVPRYCILIRLKNPRKIEPPFQINKKGFGSGGAWITVSDIGKVVKQRCATRGFKSFFEYVSL